jgi:LysM repeat protein
LFVPQINTVKTPMARVIVILGLMIALTATMFWITRKPVATAGVTTPGAVVSPSATPTTTVPLADLKAPPSRSVDEDLQEKVDETHSTTSADPRPVTNPAATLAADGSVAGAVSATPTGEALSTETAAATGALVPATAQDVTSGPVAGAAPSIGTAGIDHKNNASFTGTATPGDKVALVWDNKPVSSTTADASGNWTLAFKAPDTKTQHELLVTSQGKNGVVVTGPQRAFIGPPAVPGGLPHITLKAAEQTKTAQDVVAETVAGEPKTGIIVEEVFSNNTGAAVLSGRADPGATIKVAINGKKAGETVVGADGGWSLSAANETGKEADRLRLELVDAKGTKLDETEVPHKVPVPLPVKVASNEKPLAKEFPSVLSSEPGKVDVPVKAEAPATAVDTSTHVPAVEPPSVHEAPKKNRIVRVRRGDSLWRIAKRHLGNGKKWARFYRLNKRKIDNPDLIYPGQTLILPG